MDQYRPMDFAVIQSPQEEKHFQADTEVIYIVLGSAEVQIMDRVYHLAKMMCWLSIQDWSIRSGEAAIRLCAG